MRKNLSLELIKNILKVNFYNNYQFFLRIKRKKDA